MSSFLSDVTIDDPSKDSNGAVWSELVDEHNGSYIFHFQRMVETLLMTGSCVT